MKTETVNRVQDLVSQDAGLGTRVEATLAAAQKTTPVGRGRSQSEPSLVLFVRRRALINFQVPSSPFAPFEHRSLDLLSVSDHPASRNQHHIYLPPSFCHCPNSSFLLLPSSFLKDALAESPIPVFSQPYASPRQGCASLGKATQASKVKTSASLACKASFLSPTATPQPFPRKTLALLRFVAPNTAYRKSRKRGQGVLPKYRRAVVPAAETHDEQRMWTFPADPASPAPVSVFGQHARHEVPIDSLGMFSSVSAKAMRQSHSSSSQSLYCEIPAPQFALYDGISRYITGNNAFARKIEKASPITQNNEMQSEFFMDIALIKPQLTKVQQRLNKVIQGYQRQDKPPKKTLHQALRRIVELGQPPSTNPFPCPCQACHCRNEPIRNPRSYPPHPTSNPLWTNTPKSRISDVFFPSIGL
ncbi:MAG: hypothetical protein JWM16_2625 [Verrucomicrobiales bacterium]|nr:hypothetical protein [Verrucomicrobiales bacterium]